jgi:hypothetical protein
LRWWTQAELSGYTGTDLLAPHDLAGLLAALIAGGVPPGPVQLGP